MAESSSSAAAVPLPYFLALHNTDLGFEEEIVDYWLHDHFVISLVLKGIEGQLFGSQIQ